MREFSMVSYIILFDLPRVAYFSEDIQMAIPYLLDVSSQEIEESAVGEQQRRILKVEFMVHIWYPNGSTDQSALVRTCLFETNNQLWPHLLLNTYFGILQEQGIATRTKNTEGMESCTGIEC